MSLKNKVLLTIFCGLALILPFPTDMKMAFILDRGLSGA